MTSTVNEQIGERVHQLLWRRNIPQRELAGRLHLTQQSISRKLRGRTAFAVDELIEVAAFLDVPVTDLLPRKDSNLQPAGYGGPRRQPSGYGFPLDRDALQVAA